MVRVAVSGDLTLTTTVPADTIETIVCRVAEVVFAKMGTTTTATPYMTVDEAAEYLRCSPQRVYDLASSGRLPRYKEGRRTLHLRTEVTNLIEPERP